MRTRQLLEILLRLMAAVHVLALVGVVLPVAMMNAAHGWLGLGTFPDAPIAWYLARSVSALYAIYGGLLWLCATDVFRYSGIIRYFCYTGFAFAGFITVLDIRADLPWFWLLAEGPGLVCICIVFLVLLRAAEAQRNLNSATGEGQQAP